MTAVGLSRNAAQDALEAILPNGTPVYVGLLTAIPSDMSETGLVELTGVDYARISHAAWLSTQEANRVLRTNNGAVQFTVGAGGWTGVRGWAIWDDPTAGNLIGWGLMYDDALEPGPFSYEEDDVINLDPFSLVLEP